MPLPEGVWQVAAAVIAVAGAAWQFAGLKDARRAAEIRDIEQSIASAAQRQDPLQHSYRAHLLQRMQAMHGDRRSALPLAGLYGLLTLLFLGLFTSTTNWIVQVATFVALVACFMQCMRYLGIHRYTTWSRHIETGEAYEVSMVAARESFMATAKNLKPIEPGEPLLTKAAEAWRKVDASKRRDLISLIALMALAMVVALQGPVWAEEGTFAWRDSVTWASWVVTVGIAGLPILSQTLQRLCARLRPAWVGQFVRWLGQFTWAFAALLYLPRGFEKLAFYFIDTGRIAELQDLYGLLSIYVTAGILMLWMAGYVRVARLVRWLKRSRSRPPPSSA
jgi:hypothetical protein